MLCLLLIPACEPPPEDATLPPTARLDLLDSLREDLAAVRHPDDGSGHVVLTGGGDAVASERGRWAFTFTAGPNGLGVGGTLVFQVSPFWGWSPPQTVAPEAPGFTTFETDATGVALSLDTPVEGLVTATVAGAALTPGRTIAIVYGAGPALARADRFAERESTFWFAVDADGDGVRRLLDDCPSVNVRPGAPRQLVAHLPSVGRPGTPARLTIAALDAAGNGPVAIPGEMTVQLDGAAAELGPLPTVAALAQGHVEISVTPAAAGEIRAHVTSGPLEAVTNPLEVSTNAPTILWADLHGHSNLSDGTGTPEDYLAYARDVAALDVISLTDHDHWGMRPLDTDPEARSRIDAAIARMDEPGRFVTIPGYEWTSWIHGHRHVLFFDGRPATVLSTLDPTTEDPRGLWRALAERDAITVPHHTAGGPIATNWDIPPDPRFEPVTEVVSVHGSSEAEDSPSRIYSAVRGHYARDALDRGYRLGFVGSGDSHDGHPGLAHLGGPTGGLAALVGAEPTRASVLATLRARRVYATSGPRIILRFSIDEVPMGGSIVPDAAATREAFVGVIGTAPLERIDLVRSGRVVASEGEFTDASGALLATLEPLRSGEYVYARVVQRDGGLAWSSPIFVSDR